ncbi:hypothetical protein K8M07_06145 [Schnuerera sp. xch1]|uniref:hypothetical protein n=1 Tax=Schnuerera sp. xch1 TaxID=2874283 RepID=UPI001CBE6753|nr:hypothetical protein [Schnuerera sp. xch1]MBZ2174827.1 hypothetical protein [Schnuerera sp. xch1]
MDKSWKVKGFILSDAKLEHNVTIDGFLFDIVDNKTYVEIDVIGDSTEEAREIVLSKFENLSGFLSFVVDSKFKLIITDVIQIVHKGEKGYGEKDLLCRLAIPRKVTNQDIGNANQLLKESRYLDKITRTAIKYYERGIRIEPWYTEAFINYFKIIELISDKYLDEAKQEKEEENKTKMEQSISKIVKEIKSKKYDKDAIIKSAKDIYEIGKVERRRRIELAATDLGAEEFTIDDIKKLVNIRNKVSAHANSQLELINGDQLILCKSFAKKILSGYIQKQIKD